MTKTNETTELKKEKIIPIVLATTHCSVSLHEQEWPFLRWVSRLVPVVVLASCQAEWTFSI